MLRRILAVSLVAISLAACGGSSATETPSEAPVSAAPIESLPPSAEPSATPADNSALPANVIAQCSGIALRDRPATTGALIARVSTGVKVHVTEEVTGDSYTAGNCGTGGDTWYRITRVNGKSVKSLYGATQVFAAAGFFQQTVRGGRAGPPRGQCVAPPATSA